MNIAQKNHGISSIGSCTLFKDPITFIITYLLHNTDPIRFFCSSILIFRLSRERLFFQTTTVLKQNMPLNLDPGRQTFCLVTMFGFYEETYSTTKRF